MDGGFNRWARPMSVFCLALGVAAAAYMTHVSLRYWATGVVGHRLCTFSHWINCDASSTSAHGFLLGVPLAWLGLVHYVALGALLAVARRAPNQRNAILQAAVILGVIGAGVSAYLAVVMVFRLEAICPPCGLMQAASLALLFPLVSRLRAEPRRRLGSSCLVWLALVAGLQGAGMAGMLEHKGRLQEAPPLDVAAEIARHFARPKVLPGPAQAGWVADDVVDVVCFTDYQCPECRRLAAFLPVWLGPTNAARPRRLTYLHFPLDSSVNPYKPHGRHGQAGIAAQAAIAVRDWDCFGRLHRGMLRHQGRLSRAMILELAAQAGVSPRTLAARMASTDTARILRDQIELAHAAGVSGTPALFINRRRVDRFHEPAVVRGILAREAGSRTEAARLD